MLESLYESFKTNNECFPNGAMVEMFHSVKDQMLFPTQLYLVEKNIGSFSSFRPLHSWTFIICIVYAMDEIA